jgi:hypothetical protein
MSEPGRLAEWCGREDWAERVWLRVSGLVLSVFVSIFGLLGCPLPGLFRPVGHSRQTLFMKRFRL